MTDHNDDAPTDDLHRNIAAIVEHLEANDVRVHSTETADMDWNDDIVTFRLVVPPHEPHALRDSDVTVEVASGSDIRVRRTDE